MYKKQEKASEDDRNSLATCCFWLGDIDSAEFLSFFLCMVFNGSRGSEEAAECSFDQLFLDTIKEQDGTKYCTLYQQIWRKKVDETQHLHSFVHRNNFLLFPTYSKSKEE